jgi:hypothetical protein
MHLAYDTGWILDSVTWAHFIQWDQSYSARPEVLETGEFHVGEILKSGLSSW